MSQRISVKVNTTTDATAYVAMDNAVQEVKDIADDITLSNEEDGVAAYLENG